MVLPKNSSSVSRLIHLGSANYRGDVPKAEIQLAHIKTAGITAKILEYCTLVDKKNTPKVLFIPTVSAAFTPNLKPFFYPHILVTLPNKHGLAQEGPVCTLIQRGRQLPFVGQCPGWPHYEIVFIFN